MSFSERGWALPLAALVVVGSALHFLGNNVADPDLWGHVRYGELIWREQSLPRLDRFSYTASGAPWVNHEWLAELCLAIVFRLAGAPGLLALKLALGGLTLAFLIDAARVSVAPSSAPHDDAGRLHPLTVALALVPVLAVLSPGVEFRPQLFTIVLVALVGALLTRADRRLLERDGTRRALGWELPVVVALLCPWANLHGGFLVGVGMLSIYATAVALRVVLPSPERGAVGRREAVQVVALAIAGALTTLANPHGVGLFAFLARTLKMHDLISEWFPVPFWSLEFARFKLLVLAVSAGAALLWRYKARCLAAKGFDWRIPTLALAGALSFRHQRHTVLFATMAAPLLIVAGEMVRRLAIARWPELAPRRRVVALAGTGMAGIALFQMVSFASGMWRDGLNIRFGRLDYPVNAVEFLRFHGLTGNIAMPFEWGQYAIWKLAPDSRVFIDGRFETVYPQAVIDDYFAFMNGEPGWERLLDAYPTELVVVQRWREIHPRMFSRPDFVYVYSDPAALVFVRRTPGTEPALERLTKVADRTAFPVPDTVFP